LSLADLGLLHPARVGIVLFGNNQPELIHAFYQGKDAVLLSKQKEVFHPTTLPIWKYTHTGSELRKLTHSENNDLVLDKLGTYLKNRRYEVWIARILVNGATIQFEKQRDL
jgi:hypothetical protein